MFHPVILHNQCIYQTHALCAHSIFQRQRKNIQMKKVSGLLAQSEGAAKSVKVLSLPGHLKVEGLRCGSSVLNCEVKEPVQLL